MADDALGAATVYVTGDVHQDSVRGRKDFLLAQDFSGTGI